MQSFFSAILAGLTALISAPATLINQVQTVQQSQTKANVTPTKPAAPAEPAEGSSSSSSVSSSRRVPVKRTGGFGDLEVAPDSGSSTSPEASAAEVVADPTAEPASSSRSTRSRGARTSVAPRPARSPANETDGDSAAPESGSAPGSSNQALLP